MAHKSRDIFFWAEKTLGICLGRHFMPWLDRKVSLNLISIEKWIQSLEFYLLPVTFPWTIWSFISMEAGWTLLLQAEMTPFHFREAQLPSGFQMDTLTTWLWAGHSLLYEASFLQSSLQWKEHGQWKARPTQHGHCSYLHASWITAGHLWGDRGWGQSLYVLRGWCWISLGLGNRCMCTSGTQSQCSLQGSDADGDIEPTASLSLILLCSLVACWGVSRQFYGWQPSTSAALFSEASIYNSISNCRSWRREEPALHEAELVGVRRRGGAVVLPQSLS